MTYICFANGLSNISEKLWNAFDRALVATINFEKKKKDPNTREYWKKLFNRVNNPKLLLSKNVCVWVTYLTSVLHNGSLQEKNYWFQIPFCTTLQVLNHLLFDVLKDGGVK